MRRTCIVTLLVLSSVGVFAQPFDPFRPESPIVMGRGGSFTATATGYNSFFYNPAGFARAGELTLLSTDIWAFLDSGLVSLAQDVATSALGLSVSASSSSSASRAIDPAAYSDLTGYFEDLQTWIESEDPAVVQDILQTAAANSDIQFESGDDISALIAAAGTEDIISFLEAVEVAAEANPSSSYPDGLISNMIAEVNAALPSGNMRIGGQIGMGYVGNGLGLGLFVNAEAAVDGTNILQAYGTAYNTITFVGGLGLTFGNFDVGVSIRPTIFGYTRVNAAPILSSYLAGGTIDYASMFAGSVFYGSGLGVDAGALWSLGPISVGLAVRDLLGTQISYRKSSFDAYYQALMQASLPVGSDLTSTDEANAWVIPMKVNAGLQFHPDLGVLSYLVDPSVSVDLLDMTSAIRTWQAGEQVTPQQIISMLNFGGEVDLLRFLSLRAGYYGGYLSGGVGLDIFFLDVNAAIAGDFGQDGSGSWGFTNVGGSVEVAIRF